MNSPQAISCFPNAL